MELVLRPLVPRVKGLSTRSAGEGQIKAHGLIRRCGGGKGLLKQAIKVNNIVTLLFSNEAKVELNISVWCREGSFCI